MTRFRQGHSPLRAGCDTVARLRKRVPPGTVTLTSAGRPRRPVPDPVETTDPDGVDHAWVMQTTFVVTVAVGAPLVALLSLGADLPNWTARATFALRVGALVWFGTAVVVYVYARRRAG